MRASIEKIKWVSDMGNTKAFLDICFDNMIIVKGFKIMDSQTGRFLAPPSRKGKDDKWYADVFFRDKATADGFKEHILSLAKPPEPEPEMTGEEGAPTHPDQIKWEE